MVLWIDAEIICNEATKWLTPRGSFDSIDLMHDILETQVTGQIM